MAVFETIGVHKGMPLFLEEHCRQCLEGCRLSGFQVPAAWFGRAANLLKDHLQPSDTGVTRMHVTAGDGGPGELAANCRMLVSYEPREAVPRSVYARGYRLQTCRSPFAPALNGRKTHNYWPNVAALQAALASGADEGLVFNAAGGLASACMANIFVATAAGSLVTPPLSSGARAGVVRRWVLGVENVREQVVERSDLQQAREIFLTNSWLGIMPASHFDGVALPSSGAAEALMSKYQCLFN